MQSSQQSALRTKIILKIEEKRKLTYSEKRLIKDLEELEEQVDPSLGISAQPLNDNLMKWHANVRGPEGSPYEDTVLHLQIEFPPDYPNSAPTITQLCIFQSPFFQRDKFFSEMVGEDWCSGYSVFSILIQIQTCLFDYQPGTQNAIKKEMEKVRVFKCLDCDHDGTQNKVWPPFECILEGGPKTFASLTDDERLIDETYCFHTRLNVKQTLLGTGVAYSRMARTKQINKVYTTIDYVSLKAFKEGLRKSINKKKFTHWIPLYFGEAVSDKQKTLDHFRKCLSQLATNRNDQFDESLILKVMPYMMLTHALQVLGDKAYSSIKGLRMFLCFHRAFLFLLDAHPNVRQDLEIKIKNFIENENFRHKNLTPDLGVLFTLISVSHNYSFEQLKQILVFESLDRKVLWTSKKVPQLLDIENQALDENRAKESFECNLQSFQLQLFFYFFISQILEKNTGVAKNLEEIKNEYDKRYCRLDPKVEEVFQKEVKEIQNCKNFETYFLRLGFPAMKLDKLNQVLKQAVKNSALKKYHGGIELSFPIPDSNERVLQLIEEEGLFNFDTWDESFEDHCLYQLIQRYPTIALCLGLRPKLKPGQLAFLSDLNKLKNVDLYLYLQNPLSIIDSDLHIQTLGQLLTKLDAERALHLNQYAKNVDLFIDKVLLKVKDAGGVQSLCLTLRCFLANLPVVMQLDTLKSLKLLITSHSEGECEKLVELKDQYFNLESLEIINGESNLLIKLNDGIVKFIESQNTSLKTLVIDKLEFNQQEALNLLNAKMSALTHLTISNCQSPNQAARAIAEIIKMNAKTLTYVNLSNNHLGPASLHILEALGSCKLLSYLDLSQTDLNEVQLAEFNNTFTNILKESELQVLKLTDNNLTLNQQFFEALSSAQKLTELEISNSLNYPGFEEQIARMIVKRAQDKKPVIKFGASKLDLNTLNIPEFNDFSLPDVEEQKSDETNFNGQSFAISESTCQNVLASNMLKGYTHLTFEKAQGMNQIINKTLSQAKIIALQITNSQITLKGGFFKQFIQRIIEQPKIQHLDLSRMQLGVGEALALSKFVEQSQSLNSLNLYANKFGVEGARYLAQALEKNNNLEELDLGCNRIRNKGAKAIAQAVLGRDSPIRVLALKNNFMNEKGFKAIATLLLEKCGALNTPTGLKLKVLLTAGNEISLFEFQHLNKVVKEKKIPLYADGFDRLKHNTDSCLFLSDVNPKTVTVDKVESKLKSQNKEIIVKEVKIAKGQKTKKTKNNHKNYFMFVDFDHPNAVAQSLKLSQHLIH